MEISIKNIALIATTVLMPNWAFALGPTDSLDQAHCEGTKYVMQESHITVAELEAMAPHLMPVPEGAYLMRYESDDLGGQRYFHWSTERTGYTPDTYCYDVYYRQRFPQKGNWLFKPTRVDLSGCPDGMDPTKGMSTTIGVHWGFNGPDDILERFPMKFDMTMIDPLHWTAEADQMPQVPGTVLISYDFKAVSPVKIDVDGTLDIKINGGGMNVTCAGSFSMEGAYLGE